MGRGAVVLMCSAGGLSFRLDSWRDGWHAWPQGHSWPGLQGDVDAAFSWDKRMYLIQVGPPPGVVLPGDITWHRAFGLSLPGERQRVVAQQCPSMAVLLLACLCPWYLQPMPEMASSRGSPTALTVPDVPVPTPYLSSTHPLPDPHVPVPTHAHECLCPSTTVPVSMPIHDFPHSHLMPTDAHPLSAGLAGLHLRLG